MEAVAQELRPISWRVGKLGWTSWEGARIAGLKVVHSDGTVEAWRPLGLGFLLFEGRYVRALPRRDSWGELAETKGGKV